MNTKNTAKPTIWQRLYSGSGWALLTMFVWELVEEGLENLIAYTISSVAILFTVKVLSTFGIILATQGIKVLIKRLCVPIVKRITYKEGNDKMTKLKNFFVWLFANKKSILGVASSAVITLSGTGVIDVSVLPELIIGNINITPIIYYGLLAVLAIVGICGKGFEKIKTYFDRIAEEKAIKADKAIIKEANKELKAEAKKANQTQAQQEKAKAKEEAEAQKKAEKEKADAEHRAKLDEAKAKIVAEQNAKQS